MNPIGSTRLYCLLGNPVSHSISPAMHNLAFDTLGLDNSYMAFNVEPDDLTKVVDEFCEKYSSRIANDQYLIYTKDYFKDGTLKYLPAYLAYFL